MWVSYQTHNVTAFPFPENTPSAAYHSAKKEKESATMQTTWADEKKTRAITQSNLGGNAQ